MLTPARGRTLVVNLSATASGWIVLIGFVVLIGALVYASEVVVPVLLALVLSILLRPAVRVLTRWGMPRVLAALILLAALVTAVSLSALLLTEPLTDLVAKAPRVVGEMRVTVDKWTATASGGSRLARATAAGSAATSATMLSIAGWLATQATDALIALGLAVVLTYFTLVWGSNLVRSVVSALRPRGSRRTLLQICRGVRTEIGRYLSIIALVNLCFGAATALVLYAIGVRHALAFGALAMLLNFVPFVGAAIMFTLLAIAAVSDDGFAVAALGPPLAFMAVHLLESQFVTPHILGLRLVLSPLVVIAAVIVGTTLLGIGGAFLAVPILIALKVASDWLPRWRRWGQVLGRGNCAASQLRTQPIGQPLEYPAVCGAPSPAAHRQAPRPREVEFK